MACCACIMFRVVVVFGCECVVAFPCCRVAIIDKFGAFSLFIVRSANTVCIVAHGLSIRKYGGRLRGAGAVFFCGRRLVIHCAKAVVVFGLFSSVPVIHSCIFEST